MQLQLDKPMRPYCGEHNGHPDGVEMELIHLCNGHFRFRCPKCKSLSQERSSKALAIRDANRRFQPMQKPLELKEFLYDIIAPFPVWLEKKEDGTIEPIIARYFKPSKNGGFVVMDGFCGDVDKYNIAWRVWHTLNRPTFNESAAAKWEENHEASTP